MTGMLPRMLVVFILATATLAAQDAPLRRGDVFPRWREGYLDIHQIVTGRGNPLSFGLGALTPEIQMPPVNSSAIYVYALPDEEK